MFDYLIEKIKKADFEISPYKHIYIENFFNESDFNEIIKSNQNLIENVNNDEALFEKLESSGYKIIEFPGCITDKKRYMKWRENQEIRKHNTCESAGMTLRLAIFKEQIMKSLNEFFTGEEFNRAISEKFGIDIKECNIDGGIQKYLDGYEISPHPDIRRKALTFMVNINPNIESEKLDHHTRYCTLKNKRKYVEEFWMHNENVERCWIPWDWCDVNKIQSKNNSIVIFSPNNSTIHAVKANYDHLKGQRTQLYGNLWYKKNDKLLKREWEKLDIIKDTEKNYSKKVTLKDNIKKIIPDNIKSKFKNKTLKRNIQ